MTDQQPNPWTLERDAQGKVTRAQFVGPYLSQFGPTDRDLLALVELAQREERTRAHVEVRTVLRDLTEEHAVVLSNKTLSNYERGRYDAYVGLLTAADAAFAAVGLKPPLTEAAIRADERGKVLREVGEAIVRTWPDFLIPGHPASGVLSYIASGGEPGSERRDG